LDSETKYQADTFKGQIDIYFPPLVQRAPTSFSTNLTDLESVDFRVKPTKKLHEHLLIDGDTVNVFKLVVEDVDKLLKYEQKKAAMYVIHSQNSQFADTRWRRSALGIATLGREVLASLKALYGRDEFFSKAEEAEIFEAKNAVLRTLGVRYLTDRCIDYQPRVWNQIL